MKRKKLEKKLAKRRAALRVLTQHLHQAELLNQHYAMWLHEMRSPLLVLQQGLVEIKPNQLSPDHQAWWSMVETAAQQLNQNINDLLSLSQLKNHAILLQNQPFDLTAILQSLHSMAKILLGDKPIDLVFDVPKSPIWLQGDAFRLTQVLSNLLTNAIKFTASGQVKLTLHQKHNNEYIFSLADTGCGLTVQQQQKLFQPFQQFLQTSSAVQAGTGLGLFIVHSLVEAMHGSIEVESILGKGSQFSVTLSFSPAQMPSQVEVANNEVDLAVVEPIRLLLADDADLSRQFVMNLLADQPVEIVEVVDGAQALNALQKMAFDYALLDRFMPGFSGEQVCQQIRQLQMDGAQEKLKAVYLVSAEQVVNADLNHCFDSVLVKPLDKKQLLRLLNLKQPVSAKKTEKIFCKKIIHGKIPHELNGMLPQFILEVEQILSDLHRVLTSTDQSDVGDLVHRLKGSFMLFQLSDMTQLVEDLQQLIPNESTQTILAQLDKIGEQFTIFKSSCA